MITLAPVAKVIGKQTIQFFIPDGKYRMQVFALEDLQDGNMTVYCPDVIAECVQAGLLARHEGAMMMAASPVTRRPTRSPQAASRSTSMRSTRMRSTPPTTSRT